MAKSLPGPSVAEAISLMQKARSRGRGRRSPIMVWMQQNREELAAAFIQTAPAWSVLATYLGERGINDGDGKPPSARSTREAWARVKALAATTPGSGDSAASVPTDDSDGAQLRPAGNAHRFRPVKLRGITDARARATPPDPAAALPPNPEPGVDVDDLLSRFMPGATPRA